MIPIRCLFLTRRFSSLCQSKKSPVYQLTRISYNVMRFNSIDHNKDAPDDGTNEEETRKLKYIKLEISLLHDQGQNVPNPNSINKRHWDALLKLRTKTARMDYYKFLFVTEKKKENEMIKKQEKKRAYLAFKELQAQQPTELKSHNRFLLRIYSGTMDFWRNNRLIRAMQFGDKLIFDCSYDQYMTTREAHGTAKQLTTCFADNRLHTDPFDLHFCNVDFNGKTMKMLEQRIPTVRNKEFPLNLYEGSYLDLFAKNKLVYLTPHCQNDLQEYDSHSIYIVGAMVDKGSVEPLSLMKAKELGLKMARLPLDRYLQWGIASKSLSLDQVLKIMLDLKTNRNWYSALRHVPRRKIVNEVSNEQREDKKWSENVNKFKKVYSTESIQFTADQDDQNNTLSTADKFRKKVRIGNKIDFNQSDDNARSTTDKFRKVGRTGDSNNRKKIVNVKELFVK